MTLRSSRFVPRPRLRLSTRQAVFVVLLCVAAASCATAAEPTQSPQSSVSVVTGAPGAAIGDSSVSVAPVPSASEPSAAPLVGRPLDVLHGDSYGAGETEPQPGYDLRIDAPDRVRVGDHMATRFVVRARPDWKINLEYPVELDISAPTGLSPSRQTWQLTGAEMASEKACEFLVNWRPIAPGAHRLAGELRFGMCRDSACVPVREQIAVEFLVSDYEGN